jgi:hypothetical protein
MTTNLLKYNGFKERSLGWEVRLEKRGRSRSTRESWLWHTM